MRMNHLAAMAAATILIAGCAGQSQRDTSTPTAPGTTTPSPTATTTPTEAPAAWWQIADIPTVRSEAAVAVFRDRQVLVIGGIGGMNRVDRYDSATNSWATAPDLPIGVVDAMAATVDGLQNNSPQGVFVFGGYLADGSPTTRSYRFDYRATTWEEIAPMPAPRAAGAAVGMGGSIFIIGGSDGSGLVAPTYRYDVTTRQWRTVAPIPTPRDHLAAVGNFKNRLCAIGGRQSPQSLNLATFECYDPAADTWVRMPDTPFARSGAGAVENDGVIYVVGGEQAGRTSAELDIFDTRTNTWSRGPDLPTARYGLGVVVIPWNKDLDATGKNAIFTAAHLLVLGGAPSPGGTPTATCEALNLDWQAALPPGSQTATPSH